MLVPSLICFIPSFKFSVPFKIVSAPSLISCKLSGTSFNLLAKFAIISLSIFDCKFNSIVFTALFTICVAK